MPSLVKQSDYRTVQKLLFCYMCGRVFTVKEARTRDHVPPQTIFLLSDREPLWLPTHTACNGGVSGADELIGQVIALKHSPGLPKFPRLKFATFEGGRAALANIDIDDAVFRWVRGCHTALYNESLVGEFKTDIGCAIVTPFPRAPKDTGVVDPIRPQHLKFVETIKLNRLKDNLDRVVTNQGKFRYECVWAQCDDGRWMCIFAIDLYDWKDLGRTPQYGARGCAGFYMKADGTIPVVAAKAVTSPIAILNRDPLDPFGP